MPNAGAGDFDCYQPLRHDRDARPRSLWLLRRAAGGARLERSSRRARATAQPQSLFQKAGTDTFYWVVGVTVDAVAAPRHAHWTYQIYQNSADDLDERPASRRAPILGTPRTTARS